MLLSRVRNSLFNEDDDTLPLLQRTHLMNDEDFREIFRISREAFSFILAALRHHQSSKHSSSSMDMDDRTALYITLYRLSTHRSSNSLAVVFQMPATAVRTTYLTMVQRLCELDEYISFPHVRDRPPISREFPSAVCALGVGFVQMNALAREDDFEQYTNEDDCLGVYVRAMVLRNGHICNFDIKPGGEHPFYNIDSCRDLFDPAKTNPLLLSHQLCLVGECLPTREWTIVPYPLHLVRSPHLREHRCHVFFNERLAHVVRITAEKQIARLKQRFRSLRGKSPYTENSIYMVLRACAVVHNICVEVGDNSGFETEDFDEYDYDDLEDEDELTEDEEHNLEEIVCPDAGPHLTLTQRRLMRLQLSQPSHNIVSAEFPVPRQHQPTDARPPMHHPPQQRKERGEKRRRVDGEDECGKAGGEMLCSQLIFCIAVHLYFLFFFSAGSHFS